MVLETSRTEMEVEMSLTGRKMPEIKRKNENEARVASKAAM